MGNKFWAMAFLITLVLQSCAAIDSPPTMRDVLGYGYNIVTTLADTTVELNERGTITDEQRAEIREELTQALEYLDEARGLINTADSVNGLRQLNLALGIIQAVTQRLEPYDGG